MEQTDTAHKIKGTWGRRILKIILWVAGIWLCLLLTLQAVLSPKVINLLIDRYASGLVEGDINTGKVSVSLFRHFPNVGARIEDFSLTSSKEVQHDTIIRIDRMAASINLLSLMRSNITIPFAHIDDASATLTIGESDFDTVHVALNKLRIRRHRMGMKVMADASADLHMAEYGRFSFPIGLKCVVSLPKDSVMAISVSDLSADIASIPLEGNADVRMHNDRLFIDGKLHVNGWKLDTTALDYLGKIYPAAEGISTDASAEISLTCTGDYIYSDSSLPDFEISLTIPESTIGHEDFDESIKFGLDLMADNLNEGRIKADIKEIFARGDGLDITAKAGSEDILEDDPQIWMNGNVDIDLNKLKRFLPDTLDISATGKVHASVDGKIRPSQIDLYRFSESELLGKIHADSIILAMPKDSISARIGETSITLGPETRSSKIESGKAYRLMGIGGEIAGLDISYGQMRAEGKAISISAKGSTEVMDSSKVGRLGGRIGAERLNLKDASGMELMMKGTSNGFQMIPKRGKPEIPVMSLTSRNDQIILKDGVNRAILTDADIFAIAAMNSIERRQKARIFMDSLAKAHPEVPRDSLFRFSRAGRVRRELPEWLKEEDFRKNDINIKLDETLAKYFREWDMNGSINIRTGIVMTPYFPLRNILRGFEVKFDNDKVGIDSLKVMSGTSEIAAKGELTGLRRALLGHGGLKLDMDLSSRKMDANEMLVAYNSGSRFIPPAEDKDVSEASNAEFFKMVTTESISQKDTVTPLIVIPANLSADIRLGMNDIEYSDLHISSLKSHLTMRERCVQVTGTEALSNVGDIGFEGFYATRSKQDIKAGFSFNFSDITAEKAISLIPAVDSLMPLLKSFYGKLDCELAATASIDTNMNILPPSIKGIIRINGNNMSLKENEMFRSLAKKLMFKNKKEGYIKEMSVEGVISDSRLEVFPFILKLDRYTLALSGVQNLDQSFRYHASLIKSPFLVKLGVDIYGDSFDDIGFKIGKAKYKNTNVPVFSEVIDTTRINLVNSIRGIFDKGVEAAVTENEKQEAINRRKQDLGYVTAADKELEALSDQEQKQFDQDKAILEERMEAEESLSEAVEEINN